MPRLLGYPLLGAAAGCVILIGLGAIFGEYSVALYPVPLLAAAAGIAAAREWNRPAQRAFVGGCLGVMLAFVALLPFDNHPGLLVPAMGLGLASGIGISYRLRR
ncbi:MAG TPA: hypothetical protein VJT14_13805 [Candidatus Dormibacteraeota bacterium]|nr:hypothetical protein [Candidatus Dormibacteraeota bacterium]